jgi:hypothetical protein
MSNHKNMQSSKRQRISTPKPPQLGTVWSEVLERCGVHQLAKLAQTCTLLRRLSGSLLVAGFGKPIHPAFQERALEIAYSNQLKKCLRCRWACSTVESLIPAPLCSVCKTYKGYTLISPTQAKKRYFLQAKHLEGIPSRLSLNGKLSSSPCRVMLKSDVKQRALEHYGSAEGLDRRRSEAVIRSGKRYAAKLKLEDERKKKAREFLEARRERLLSALRDNGLVLSFAQLEQVFIVGRITEDNRYSDVWRSCSIPEIIVEIKERQKRRDCLRRDLRAFKLEDYLDSHPVCYQYIANGMPDIRTLVNDLIATDRSFPSFSGIVREHEQ